MRTAPPIRRLGLLLLLLVALAIAVAFPGVIGSGSPPGVPSTSNQGEILRAEVVVTRAQVSPSERDPVIMPAIVEATARTDDADHVRRSPHWDLRVVYAGNAAPVADATVWYAHDYAGIRESFPRIYRGERMPWYTTRERRLEASGRRTTTDAEGHAVLYDFAGGTQVCARRDDWFGYAYLHPATRDGTVVLELHRQLRLLVDVVDAMGSPLADTPVYGQLVYPNGSRSKRRPVGHTDREGRVVVTEVEMFAERARGATMRLYAGICGIECGSIETPIDGVGDRYLRIDVPAGGRLRVVVRDRTGAVVPEAGGVRVTDHDHPDRWYVHLDRGVGVIDAVPIGRRFKVGHSWTGETVIDGPGRPSEEVCVTLTTRTDVVRVKGRAVDENGRPLDGGVARLQWPVGNVWPKDVRIGVDGRCTWVVDVLTAEDAARHNRSFAKMGELGTLPTRVEARTSAPAKVESIDARGYVDITAHLGEVALPEHGVIDLGDFSFRRPPVLVSGRVVGGTPGRGVNVSVRLVDTDQKIAWADVPADGTFEIRGQANEPLSIRAGRQGWLPAELTEVAPGTRGVVLEMGRGVAFRARVVDLEKRNLRVVLSPDLPDSTSSIVGHRRGAYFVWQAVAPGDYRLEAFATGEREACFATEVSIAEDHDVLDTFVIDLADQAWSVALTFVDDAGDQLAEIHARMFVGGRFPSPDEKRGADHVVTRNPFTLTVSRPVDLAIRVRGFEPTIARGVSSDRVIALRARQ